MNLIRRLYQKLPILHFLVLFTFICLFAETIKYPGFIANHFFVDVKVYITLVIVLLLFTDIKSKFLGFILKANKIFLIGISFIYLTLSLLEGAHYLNYVLATYKIHLDSTILLVLFSLFIFLAEKFKEELPKVKGRMGVIYLVI